MEITKEEGIELVDGLFSKIFKPNKCKQEQYMINCWMNFLIYLKGFFKGYTRLF